MASRTPAVLAWLARQVPTLLVLGGLVALWMWGAAHDWKLPSRKPPDVETKPEEGGDSLLDPGPISLPGEDAVRIAGIEVEKARQRDVSQQVDAPAVLAFDQTRYAHLAPRVSGTAWRVPGNVGASVKQGDVLALVSAPDVSKAKADFLASYVQYEIRHKTVERYHQAASAVPERQLREAELALREARIRLVNDQQALVNLGLNIRLEDLRNLSDDEVARKVRQLGLPVGLNGEEVPGNLLPLVAPFDGLVVRRDMVVGEVVGPGQPAFVVADVRRLWVQLDVRLEDVDRLASGQPVTFRSSTGQTAAGTLTWVSAEVDPKTRTVKARAEVENYEGKLRPATFGRATVEVNRQSAVTVPDAAVQWDGRCHRVFVRRDEKTFEPRLVLPGVRSRGQTELVDARALLPASLAGTLGGPVASLTALGSAVGGSILTEVRPGELVVTAGSHILKSEMHKARIAGEE